MRTKAASKTRSSPKERPLRLSPSITPPESACGAVACSIHEIHKEMEETMSNDIDVQKIVQGARLSRFHGLILFWCVLILVLDGYDLAVVGAALPSIMKDMGVNAAKAGFMASSALFGMMFGAIYLGTLADKIGRPIAICACSGLFAVFAAAAALTHDPVAFGITRFLAGLGIGGVLPIV